MFDAMMMALMKRIALESHDITRDRDTMVLMTRFVLRGQRDGWTGKGPRIYAHRILRSDVDSYHDHPWNFRSVILSGGYYEHTPNADGSDRKRWYGPGRILTRPATSKHWLELPAGSCPVWSLVFVGPKIRSWGFWTSCGFLPWREHEQRIAMHGEACPEGVTQ